MSRLFTPPRKVRVQANPDGEPARLYWRGRWSAVRVANRWRLADDWWRQGGEVVREYYKLRTVAGPGPVGPLTSTVVCVVFRDEVAGDWYLERILD